MARLAGWIAKAGGLGRQNKKNTYVAKIPQISLPYFLRQFILTPVLRKILPGFTYQQAVLLLASFKPEKR
jgi:hypothetical protein